MSRAIFVDGSLMRHIMVMTGAATIGVSAMFAVDLADIWFLSQLGDVAITDAISYAGPILFFTASVSIGLMITMGALVSRSLGAQRFGRARRLATSIFAYSFLIVSVIAALVWAYVPELLTLLGAEGRAHELGQLYLRIILATMPLLSLSMSAGGLLRAYGDAKMTMWVTVSGALVNAILDPILIFGFDLDVVGAAIATVAGRMVMLVIAVWAAFFRHRALAAFSMRHLKLYIPAISGIAVPAILTNVATPLGAAYVTRIMADFGDGAVTGLNIATRLNNVVFAIMFALSGAVGPIIGQNFGAGQFARVRQSFFEALKFMGLYVVIAGLLLYLLREPLIASFHLTGIAAELLWLFCSGLAVTFLFSGCLFVANAGFNNLGRPHYSTLFNFGRATLGTIPFVYLGAILWGAKGVLVGHAFGGVLFGVAGYAAVLWHVGRIERGEVIVPGIRRPSEQS